MRHPIDPKIDCVFKALLGAEDNRNLLVHFLNAILGPELPRPIAQVEILNPYNECEFLADKLSIVDVKARDDQARLYQVEIQLLTHRDLPARILYTWTDLYSQQLQSGQGSEKERAYDAYQARQNFLREQQSIQRELDDARAARAVAEREKEAERQAKETERQAKDEALAEVERLKALLQGQGTVQ
jgi:hypothetical protein